MLVSANFTVSINCLHSRVSTKLYSASIIIRVIIIPEDTKGYHNVVYVVMVTHTVDEINITQPYYSGSKGTRSVNDLELRKSDVSQKRYTNFVI